MDEDTDEENEPKVQVNETISNKLIRKIIQEKREKKFLAEDLKNIKQNFISISKFVKNDDDKTIQNITNILINHHYLFYYIFLQGMEKAQDAYCEKYNSVEFTLFQDYLNNFTGKYEGIITRDNGFHVNQALIMPNGCDMEQEFYRDYEDFNQVYQPVVDEKYLIPSHVRMINQIYGQKVFNNFRISQYVGHSANVGYSSLNWAFLNLNDIERVCVYSAYQSVRRELENYGKLTEIDELGDESKLEAQLNLLKNKVQARQLRHALMCFEGKCTLPEDIEGYNKLNAHYKEGFYFQVIFEKDKAFEIDKKKREANSNLNYKPSFLDQETDGLSQEKIEQLKEIAAMKAINVDIRRNTESIFAKAEIL